MLKKRLIPVLFLKNGLIVRSEGFRDFREFGNPINQLERLNDWEADELIYIDITREGEHDLKRDDHKVRLTSSTLDILKAISKQCFMPLTFGGRIKKFEEAAKYIENGADKIIVNTQAYDSDRSAGIIEQIARYFGSQCAVVGIDVKKNTHGEYEMFVEQGRKRVPDYTPVQWAKRVEEKGAGEIFLNSIDRDGSANGYDIEIIDQVSKAVKIPVIACGGAGTFDDFIEVLKTDASAAAAGNIFNFTENAYIRAKKELVNAGCPVKPYIEHPILEERRK